MKESNAFVCINYSLKNFLNVCGGKKKKKKLINSTDD